MNINNKEFIKIYKNIINFDYLSKNIITDSILFNRNRIYIFNNLITKVLYKVYI